MIYNNALFRYISVNCKQSLPLSVPLTLYESGERRNRILGELNSIQTKAFESGSAYPNGFAYETPFSPFRKWIELLSGSFEIDSRPTHSLFSAYLREPQLYMWQRHSFLKPQFLMMIKLLCLICLRAVLASDESLVRDQRFYRLIHKVRNLKL